MTADDWVKIIGAIGSVLVLAIAAAMPVLIAKINKVHVLVNSQHTELVRYVGELTEALHGAGMAVPTPTKGAVTGGSPTREVT